MKRQYIIVDNLYSPALLELEGGFLDPAQPDLTIPVNKDGGLEFFDTWLCKQAYQLELDFSLNSADANTVHPSIGPLE